ncbi:MAG TPA: 3-oxoacyl-ACP reductase FabG [bacterium]|jgi:3-oxoacyl-[acyl-carrier protein] reductase
MMLKDQAALVTGGGAGIGAATARLLAGNGAAVMVADWNEDAAMASADAIRKAGGKAAHVKCDVSQQAQARNAVDKTVEAFGRIDILINNAGITRDASALKMTPEQWDQVIGVNLSGVFYCSQAAAAHMREKNYGRIVNASSVSGFGNFGQSNYSATKAGLVGMTRTMAIEWGRYGITVNAIAPGFIRTSMTDAIPEEIREASAKRIPVGRVGDPYDIARIYLFYASPESSFLTGTLLVADGGQTLLH